MNSVIQTCFLYDLSNPKIKFCCNTIHYYYDFCCFDVIIIQWATQRPYGKRRAPCTEAPSVAVAAPAVVVPAAAVGHGAAARDRSRSPRHAAVASAAAARAKRARSASALRAFHLREALRARHGDVACGMASDEPMRSPSPARAVVAALAVLGIAGAGFAAMNGLLPF